MARRLASSVILVLFVVALAQDPPEKRDDKPAKDKRPDNKEADDKPPPDEDDAPGMPIELPSVFATNPMMPFPAGVPWGALGLPWRPWKIRIPLRDESETIGPAQIAKGLTSESPLVRKRLVLWLGRLSEPDEELRGKVMDVLPALYRLVGNADEVATVREEAARVVGKFEAVEQAESLVRGLGDKEAKEQRVACCKALAVLYARPTLDEEGKKRISGALEAALLDREPDVQLAAATALETIDRRKTQAKPFRLRVKETMADRVTVKEVAKLIRDADSTLQVEVGGDGVIEVSGSLPGLGEVLKKVKITVSGKPTPLVRVLDILPPRKEKPEKD